MNASDVELLAINVGKCTEMCMTLAESCSALRERVSALEHVVAVQHYQGLPPGIERGRIGALLSEGLRVRLTPEGSASLKVVAQEVQG